MDCVPVKPAGYEATKVHRNCVEGNAENPHSSTVSPEEGDVSAVAPAGNDWLTKDQPLGKFTTKPMDVGVPPEGYTTVAVNVTCPPAAE